jgi:hypothetical protein
MMFAAVVRGQQIDINTQTKGILAANRIDPAISAGGGGGILSRDSDAAANSACGGLCPENTMYKRTSDTQTRIATVPGTFKGMLYGEFQPTAGYIPTTANGTTLVADTSPGMQLFREPSSGRIGIGTATPTAMLHVTGAVVRPFDTDSIPASVTDPCNKGDIRFSLDHIYVCVATNTWRRSALNTW